MPNFGSDVVLDAVTLGRTTRAEADGAEWSLLRQTEKFGRLADEIGRGGRNFALGLLGGKASPQNNLNVLLVPGFGWIMEPNLWEISKAPEEAFVNETDGVVDSAQVAPSVKAHASYRNSNSLLGVSDSTRASGISVWQQQVPASGAWGEALDPDEAAFPGPVRPTEHVAMARVVHGSVTYPENAGYVFAFRLLSLPGVPPDNLASFYWGGPSDTIPGDNGSLGGEWLLNFRGSGSATLMERMPIGFGGYDWFERDTIPYSANPRALNTWHLVQILTLSYSRIVFRALGENSDLQAGGSDFSSYGRRPNPAGMHVYRHSAALTGHEFNRAICGAGPYRIDVRGDLRIEYLAWRLKFPIAGLLVDLPFALRERVPAGTALSLRQDTVEPPGTSIAGVLYDDTTNTPLTDTADQDFATNAGVTAYYPVFEFSSDGNQTPILKAYVSTMEGHVEDQAAALVEGTVNSVEFSGQGPDPTYENGTATIQTVTHEWERLEQRGMVPFRVVVNDPDPFREDDVVLFHGFGAKVPTEVLPLRSGQSLRSYDLQLVGEWQRIYEQVVPHAVNLLKDFRLARDARGEYQMPFVWDMIDNLLTRYCGVDPAQLDLSEIQTSSLQLWPVKNEKSPYILAPGSHPAEAAQRMAERYLGAFLFFDPNVGERDPTGVPRGMWRVLYEPRNLSDNTAAWFWSEPQNSLYGSPHHPGMYADLSTFLARGTYKRWVQRPEFNIITVIGADEPLPGGGVTKLQASMWNPRSYNRQGLNTADPTSPDYIGHEVGQVHHNSLLTTQHAVDYICRLIFDSVCYGRIWARWTAPLIFIHNTTDALLTGQRRPLRYGDQVKVDNVPAILKSCSPFYSAAQGGDRMQLARYEAVFNVAEQFAAPS